MLRTVCTLGMLMLGSLHPAYAEEETASAIDTPSIRSMVDTPIQRALEKLNVIPGISVAVYTPGDTFAKAYGVTDIETGEKAHAGTAYYVASSTKSMTAIVMAALHERGEINLDMSLAEFAPDAPFPPDIKPEQVTLRNLLANASGFINTPIAHRYAYSGDYTPDLMWQLLFASEPNEKAPLGAFQYSNYNYNVLTLLSDKKLGTSWKDLLVNELFSKAGMTHTTAYISKAERENWSIARPHATRIMHLSANGDKPVRTYLEKTDATMQSAGGVIMSANDAVKWLELLVEDGRVDGKQIVPAKAVQASRAPHAKAGGTFGDYSRDHYGLGWYIGKYGDDTLVSHFGSFSGARAHISYMPARKIGVAVFANDTPIGFRLVDLIANLIYDGNAGDETALETFEEKTEALAAWHKGINKRIIADLENREARPFKLSLPLGAYAGTYENPLIGKIVLTFEDEGLTVQHGNMHARATAYKTQDTLRVELLPGNGHVLSFDVSDAQIVKGLTYLDYSFERQ